ncbi:MAG: AsmA family protein [Deltaproteobacteria bacterium]|nr:AsmA family protein [Deltaproteobacteria bacterium]
MAIVISGPRPQIEGTLALQKLNLTRYFEPEDTPAPLKKTAAKKGKAQKPVEVDFPILHHINIDLRISTTQLTAGPLKLGQSAISFSLKSGKLMADLAVFDVCDGNATARLAFDATVPDSAIRLTAGMASISTKSCIEIFTSDSSLEGVADLSADVTSKGRTAKELFDSLNGKVSLSMGEGQADIDIPKLIAKLPEGPAVGWDAARGSETSFLSLTGEFLLRRGAESSARATHSSFPSSSTPSMRRRWIALRARARRRMHCARP